MWLLRLQQLQLWLQIFAASCVAPQPSWQRLRLRMLQALLSAPPPSCVPRSLLAAVRWLV